MDVDIVGVEGVFAPEDAVDEDAHYVEAWDGQGHEGYDHYVGAEYVRVGDAGHFHGEVG